MFELLTTDAFATWFSGLDAAPAEDVAASLEVIAQLGARAEAPGSSEWLLWYEHPSLSARPWPDPTARFAPELVRFTQEWGRFNGYVRRVIKHLESKAFVARLARLSPSDASAVARALDRIRAIAKSRPLAMAEYQRGRGMHPFRAPSPTEAASLARFCDLSEVRAAYFAALAAAGFAIADVAPTPNALREITLRSTAPGVRLLYGVDEPRDRALVVLGEWLDRSFYGDSVRRAEAIWAELLEGRPLPTRVAGPR